jgi:2-deoxy-D-gluconate 3-dehydrogenase
MDILDKFKLTGKTALVTGCRRGIGKALAVGLAEAGANIIGVSTSMELSGSEVEREVIALGRSFKAYQCDFAKRQQLYDFIRKVKSEFSKIDILVNNAGTIFRRQVTEHPVEYWDNVIEVNLNSQFILTREVGKDMVARGKGKIIFIASINTFQGGITIPGYAASKGGIGQLTKAISNEWASYGVNVNAIAPGYIATDLTKPLREDKKRNRELLERIPAGRWGEPDDLKGTVVFLSSGASNYIHGTIFNVDGGWMGR